MTKRWIKASCWMAACVLMLAACGTGQIRRVSEPAVSIQQLTVRADGAWSTDVRIENFSSIPMRFDSLDLALSIAGQPAGRLEARPALSVGSESAEILTIALQPGVAAKLAVADALRAGAGRSVGYELRGSIEATPSDARSRQFDVERSSALSPTPGLPGVLR